MTAQEIAAQEIIEIIMTQHWDMAACSCWICKAGRAVGLRPRERFLATSGFIQVAGVRVGDEYP